MPPTTAGTPTAAGRYVSSSRQVCQQDRNDDNSNGKGNDSKSKYNNSDSKDDDSNSHDASIKKCRILKITTLFCCCWIGSTVLWWQSKCQNAGKKVSLTSALLHRKKRFTSFPSPAGMSLTKLPLGRNNSVMTSLFPPRESLVVTSRLGTGNSRTFFYGVDPLDNWVIPASAFRLQVSPIPLVMVHGLDQHCPAIVKNTKIPKLCPY